MTLPQGTPAGTAALTITGDSTGTSTQVSVPVEAAPESSASVGLSAKDTVQRYGKGNGTKLTAWVALERAAERAGTRRDPAQTPTEFTTAVLASTRVDPEAVATLRGLYHRARFGETALGERDLEAARAALARIAADLTTRVGGAQDLTPAPHGRPLHDEARP